MVFVELRFAQPLRKVRHAPTRLAGDTSGAEPSCAVPSCTSTSTFFSCELIQNACGLSACHRKSQRLTGTVDHVAVGQNQWYHVRVGAPPSLVYFTGGTGF